MANKFVNTKLPWKNKDVERAIEERLEDLDAFTQAYRGARLEARKLRQRLTRQAAGEYPDSDDEDPSVDAALKQSVELVDDHLRLLREVPAKATELEAMQKAAKDKKAVMDKILSDGSPNAIDVAEVMKVKISDDKMMIMVEVVATRSSSLEFLRSLGGKHRRLLLSKEAEIAEYKRAQQASLNAPSQGLDEDEVIPSTYPDLQAAPTQQRKTQESAELQSASSRAGERAEDLARQVASLRGKLEDEQKASAAAQAFLRQQLRDSEDALKGKDLSLDQQKHLLFSYQGTVVQLGLEAAELKGRITELEEGVIDNGHLMAELQESRSEVETLKEKVDKMESDSNDKSRLEEELAEQQSQADTARKENERLLQELQGKEELLKACSEARDSAQKLADELKVELGQKRVELGHAQSEQKKMEGWYDEATKEMESIRNEYLYEAQICQANLEALGTEKTKVKDQGEEIRGLRDTIKSKDEELGGLLGSIKSKDNKIRGLESTIESRDEELRGLQGSIKSKDEKIQGLEDTIGSRDESLSRAKDDLEQLTHQISRKDQELQSQIKSVGELQADLANARRDKADVELDLGFVIRFSNLGIRSADVDVPGWTLLLRSLRVSGPVEITPDEGTPRQTWAVLPSWPGSPTSDETGSVSSELPGVRSSLDALLLELYGHGTSEGDFPCNPCLQAICSLSALVERQGVTKARSLGMVLEKLVARLRGLEATSWYEGMVMLSLRCLAAIVTSRLSGADVPGLSAVEDSLDGMMKQAGKCLGIIRQVSDGLYSSGGVEAVEAKHGLRLISNEGRRLVLLRDADHPYEVFLVVDPEQRTLRAVSWGRLIRDLGVSDAFELVHSAVIQAPAGQSDIEMALTSAEADWLQRYL